MQIIDPERRTSDGSTYGTPALANLGRASMGGRYMPYECAVSRLTVNV